MAAVQNCTWVARIVIGIAAVFLNGSSKFPPNSKRTSSIMHTIFPMAKNTIMQNLGNKKMKISNVIWSTSSKLSARISVHVSHASDIFSF